jgi:hypothetical protein
MQHKSLSRKLEVHASRVLLVSIRPLGTGNVYVEINGGDSLISSPARAYGNIVQIQRKLKHDVSFEPNRTKPSGDWLIRPNGMPHATTIHGTVYQVQYYSMTTLILQTENERIKKWISSSQQLANKFRSTCGGQWMVQIRHTLPWRSTYFGK